MRDETETPSFEEELSRKTIDTLIELEGKRTKGLINEREFEVALQTVFSITSGLTCKLDLDPFALISELSATIVKDNSFVDVTLSRSAFDDKFMMTRHKKNSTDIVIAFGTITKTAVKTANEDETAVDFAKRISGGLKAAFPNYERWV